MYESVKNEDPRTNNVSEGGNNAINIAAGVSHPKIVPFIKIIQRFNAEHESIFSSLQQEPTLTGEGEPALLREMKDF